ncbi:hemolysin family protein [Acidicapsa acidisoli]|uniref:hemolysin family protein n=1 Tax=Acidicapsa acidisoli TaxID=1615681 RepID=UPI0021DFFC08|nr:hemolysin family protein [Acidicapsa acidisoli]
MHGLPLLQIVAVAILILANGFFVAAEFALVSMRDTRIEQMIAAGVPGATSVRQLQRDLDGFLPAVQLGVTLCSLALGWIGEPLAAELFYGWMEGLPHAIVFAHIASVTVGFALITYLHVLLGELVPKSLALRRAENLAIAVAGPMLFFMAVTRPGVRLLQSSARVVLKMFRVSMTAEASAHSPEELKLIATAARRMGVLPAFQERLIHRALEIDEIPVREIMTPRQKIISMPGDTLIDAASASVIDHQHSRVPVYDETRGPEHIIGVVYAKDLARLMHFRRTAGTRSAVAPFVELRVSQVMRDVLMVPETKTVLDLIGEFQQRRRQMAIVVDEYGSTVGVVTVEDAVEQLTGELNDEFDDPARPVLTTASGALLLEGSVNLRDLETQMQWKLPRDGGVETLAGFLLMRLGKIPRGGESIVFEGRRMTVTEMDGRRIKQIRVEPVEKEVVSEYYDT